MLRRYGPFIYKMAEDEANFGLENDGEREHRPLVRLQNGSSYVGEWLCD